MARIDFKGPVESVHGKLHKDDKESFRGKHTYTLQNPRTPDKFSEHEKAYHKKFGELNKLASQINKDENRKNEYTDWEEKGYESRYRYILAELVKKSREEA